MASTCLSSSCDNCADSQPKIVTPVSDEQKMEASAAARLIELIFLTLVSRNAHSQGSLLVPREKQAIVFLNTCSTQDFLASAVLCRR